MPSPTPNINDFLSNLSKHGGIAKSERFFATVFPPLSLPGNYNQDLQFQCEATELPGIVIETGEYRTYGITKKIPIGRSYNEVTLTFFCTNDFYERPFFDKWIEQINPQSQGLDMNYKVDCVGTVQIVQLNQSQDVIYATTLIEAFPISIQPMPVNWSDNSVHKLNVTFMYTSYRVDSSFQNLLPNNQFNQNPFLV